MTEPLPSRVSDEDAVDEVIRTAIGQWLTRQDPASCCPGESMASAIRRALVSHGWGPTQVALIDELQRWLDSANARDWAGVHAWELEARIAHLRGEDHPMAPRPPEVTE